MTREQFKKRFEEEKAAYYALPSLNFEAKNRVMKRVCKLVRLAAESGIYCPEKAAKYFGER